MSSDRPIRDEGWYTVNEIAEILKVHEQTVRGWLRDGELQGVGFGGRTGWRVSEVALRRFLDERQGKALAVA